MTKALHLPDRYSGGMASLLIVDDDRMLRSMMALQLEELGYTVVEATGGAEALALLAKPETFVDAILLDREMPGMDGVAFLQALQKIRKFAQTPVIMVTGTGEKAAIGEGIEAGVFYYLVKPVAYNLLVSVVADAVGESRKAAQSTRYQRQYRHLFGLLTHAELAVQTMDEADELARSLSLAFPDPQRVIGGIAGLLENAIEHGHYHIGHDKAHLTLTGLYQAEIQRRSALPENREKRAEVIYATDATRHSLTICDQGAGFDWRQYIMPESFPFPSDEAKGIARAVHGCFDSVTYNEAGNSVTVTVACLS